MKRSALIFFSLLTLACTSVATPAPDPTPDPDPDPAPVEEEFRDPEGPEDLDFSRVGYHWGESDIPDYPVGLTIGPEDVAKALSDKTYPDTTSFLNAAIASCPTGMALLLKAGEYRIHPRLQILRSDVVLRGEGAANTVIIASRCSADAAYNVLHIGPTPESTPDVTSFTAITDSHVPVGAMYVDVATPSLFTRGDNVSIRRKATAEWIRDIRMDAIDDAVHTSWAEDLESFDILFERRITEVKGTRLYFDNPVPMDMDSKYATSYLWKSSHNRISEVGVENIGFIADCDPSDPYDEDHAESAVCARSCEHCWIRGVRGTHFLFSTVKLTKGARNITVEDCESVDPVSLITGSRRYAFSIGNGAEACIMKNCRADHDRHMFVSPNRSNGPNVFLRCTGTNCHSNGGPHCYWATLFLYDNVSLDGKMSVEDTGGEATLSSHGWQGVNHVLWNCTAPTIVCQSPWATGRNYAYGCVGTKVWGSYFNEDPRGREASEWTKGDKWRPDGVWCPEAAGGESLSSRVSPESLYESQLAERLAGGTRVYPLPASENPETEDGLFALEASFLSDGHGYSPFVGVEAEKGKAKVLTDRTFYLKQNTSYSLAFKATKLRLVWGNNNGLELTSSKGDYMTIPSVPGKKLYSIAVTSNSSKNLNFSLVDAEGKEAGENLLDGTSSFYAFASEDASWLVFNDDATYCCITGIILKYK